MVILVAGGAGYIGSHTCVELLNDGHQIVVADDLSNSSIKALEGIEKITGKNITFYQIDIRDEQSLFSVFETHAVECIIHFAARKAVGESVLIPIDYYDHNLNTTLALCKAMEKYGTRQIIFSSSATVYSNENTMPLTEQSVTGNCTNPYGWTKYMNEQILRDAANAHPEWSVVLLRYFNPIGAHESGDIGEDPAGIPNNLFPYITQTAIGRLEKLSVFGNDYDTADGTGVRDYVHVTDIAKGHTAALPYCAGHTGVSAINLGTGYGTSVLELIHTFEHVNHVKVPYQITGRREGDSPVCYADTRNAELLLQWKAEKSLEDMCRDSWRWQTKNPTGYR